MPNDTVNAAVRGFQQKLDSFKTKIEFQQLLAKSLAAEFESLTSEFESLKRLLGALLPNFESTSNNNESTSLIDGATSDGNESTSENVGSTSPEFESKSSIFESTLSNFGATLYNNGATSIKPESLSPNNESSSSNNGAISPINGATSPIRELAALIERSARESLKIDYSQPNIPSRMAEIVLALRERKRLSVTEMRQITGVSRNSLVRDIKVLKLLGWVEFHGSRKNGYFTLTASFPGF